MSYIWNNKGSFIEFENNRMVNRGRMGAVSLGVPENITGAFCYIRWDMQVQLIVSSAITFHLNSLNLE